RAGERKVGRYRTLPFPRGIHARRVREYGGGAPPLLPARRPDRAVVARADRAEPARVPRADPRPATAAAGLHRETPPEAGHHVLLPPIRPPASLPPRASSRPQDQRV